MIGFNGSPASWIMLVVILGLLLTAAIKRMRERK
jgi:hypothetical protein